MKGRRGGEREGGREGGREGREGREGGEGGRRREGGEGGRGRNSTVNGSTSDTNTYTKSQMPHIVLKQLYEILTMLGLANDINTGLPGMQPCVTTWH